MTIKRIIPVSYTHLDVYKRQTFTGAEVTHISSGKTFMKELKYVKDFLLYGRNA